MFLLKNVKSIRLISTSAIYNAGHSKWANIKHDKAIKDQQKSFLFEKLGRQIRLAILEGGSKNPSLNSALKSACEEALKKNMPNSTIQNILKKSDSNANLMKKNILEMKFMNKIFLICNFYTDNLVGNKMAIASILKRNMAGFDEARHFFNESGVVVAIDVKERNEEKIMEDGITAGANDIEFEELLNESRVTFLCEPSFLNKVRNNLIKMDYSIYMSEHVFLPKNPISLSESEDLVYQKLLEKLKSFQGIEEIYDNVKEL